MIRFFGYDKCSTCRTAKKFLQARKVNFEDLDITVSPPPKSLLQSILKSGWYGLRDLLNRSGEMYRALNMKEKVARLSEDEILDLLAKHGKLVKRPLISDGKRHTVGFDEKTLDAVWKQS